tara:strand:+ start:89 stop:334 length:246 start_codon:yes stop_codon:yes gene_type:complete
MNGLNQNTHHIGTHRKVKNPHSLGLVSMVSKLSVLQVMQMMTDDDFAFLQEYEPSTLSALCSSLSIELQEKKENIIVEKPN